MLLERACRPHVMVMGHLCTQYFPPRGWEGFPAESVNSKRGLAGDHTWLHEPGWQRPELGFRWLVFPLSESSLLIWRVGWWQPDQALR